MRNQGESIGQMYWKRTYPVNTRKPQAIQMITLYNLFFFFLFESRLSSSFYSPIIFLWGRCAKEKERSNDLWMSKMCRCGYQASPCSLLSLCGFPRFPELGLQLFVLMLQPDLDHTVCALVFTMDSHQCGEHQALVFCSLVLQYQGLAKVVWRVSIH